MSNAEMNSAVGNQTLLNIKSQPALTHQGPPTKARIKFAFDEDEYEYDINYPSSPSQTSTMSPPSRHDQPSGDQLQVIPKHKLVESGSDYASVFYQLQIKPELYDRVVTGIIQPIRHKRMKNLKSATGAMIKDLSMAFIRGYGHIIYVRHAADWLVDDSHLQLVGKQRLHFTSGDYAADGPNAHFYTILEPMWWTMRSIVFELKPSVKRQEKNGVDDSNGDIDGEKQTFVARGRGCRPKQATPGAPKEAPKARFEDNQKKVLDQIEKGIESSNKNGNWKQKYYMTANETDEAVQDLIAQFHEIRWKSDPKTFARVFDTNVGRLEEIEAIDELKTGKAAEPEQEVQGRFLSHVVGAGLGQNIEDLARDTTHSRPVGADFTIDLGQAPSSALSAPRLASEPFNTHGPPSVLNKLRLGQQLFIPSMISVYITTSPAFGPYKDKSYHWPDAPIGIADCKRFFDGLSQRAAMPTTYGFALSYGWNDIMRSIGDDDGGKRTGFSVLREDVAAGARMGVTKWRLKVLVVGDL